MDIYCPHCSKLIVFKKLFMCGSGTYECECGFKRPELNIKITDVDFHPDKWLFTIKGNPYNYFLEKSFEFEFDCTFPPLGLYNLYNGLAAIATYASFTSAPENIEYIVNKVFKGLNNSILPPGRFEVLNYENKVLGIGQGDNGNALKANTEFLESYILQDSRKRQDLNIEYIYTTPDENEEEIFEDHLSSLKSINPSKIYVLPGRNSVTMGKEYYELINKDFNAEFYPISYKNLDDRIKKVYELVNLSNADYIIASGCGEEILFWEKLKNFIKT